MMTEKYLSHCLFAMYFTMLSVAQATWRQMKDDGKLEKKRKDAVVAQFEILPTHLPGNTAEGRK
jgi:hypothetical protein